MTRDELFTDMLKLVRCSTDEQVRDLFVTAWNHGKSEGFREARELLSPIVYTPAMGVNGCAPLPGPFAVTTIGGPSSEPNGKESGGTDG